MEAKIDENGWLVVLRGKAKKEYVRQCCYRTYERDCGNNCPALIECTDSYGKSRIILKCLDIEFIR